MITFKDYLLEVHNIKDITLKKQYSQDLDYETKHSYHAHDHTGHHFATVNLYHPKDHNEADIVVHTNPDHPDADKVQHTALGPKFETHPNLIKHAFHELGKNHPEIKHFTFDRITGASKDATHTGKIKNPHYKGDS
jgi:hypothetical protein